MERQRSVEETRQTHVAVTTSMEKKETTDSYGLCKEGGTKM